MIHLDTSFLIRALVRGTPEDRALRRWIANGESLAVCSVAWAEFQCGPLTSSELAVAGAIIDGHRDFTRDDAETAARLFNESGRRRGSLIDCMIAAAALADDAPVATANRADFVRLTELGVSTAD
ncbi:MAG: PIN domain-containing protein [Gemmatimonadetes bacterium]|nr:PIN domain-containing protein [Gemmatimonadota bacterium]